MNKNNNFVYYIDIIGTCNLRCPSCPVGDNLSNIRNKDLMSLDLFEKIIQKIKYETKNTSYIGLYNWSEPFLHPDLDKFINIVNKYELLSMLSTNLNNIKNLEKVLLSKPSFIRVSLSGYYKDSYSKTHLKGNIEKVKTNLKKLRSLINKHQLNIGVDVNYHIYMHNFGLDYLKIRNLCQKLNFKFLPNLAIMMPAEKLFYYHENNNQFLLEKDNQLNELFVIKPDEYKSLLENKEIEDCYVRRDQTAINADGTVSVCCALYDSKYNIAKSFLEVPFEDLQKRKYESEACKVCMKHSIYKTYDSHKIPEVKKMALEKMAYQRNKIVNNLDR